MFKLRRWWLLCGVVLVGVVALNGVADGVVDAKAAPAPRAVCVRGGATATDGVSGRGLVCVQTTARGLRWRFQPTAVTTTTTTTTTSPSTTTTTTVPGVVAPVLVSVSASDGVQITVAGMRPDTGVYSLQWVPYGQTFNTYQMARATSPSMNVPAGWFVCNRAYTFRVFVMQAGWQLADGHQTQNVTPHSTPFDVVMPACPTPATTPTTIAPASCATGGACAVGDTGPGGGKVFYVQATGTFPCGATLASTCRYLEAAPTSGTSAWTDATYVWSGNTTELIGATAQGVAIGIGRKNTEAMVTQNDTAGRAGTFTRAYRGPNNLTDWYLPSKDELNQMCKWQRGVDWTSDATVCTGGTLNSGTGASGFSTGRYWSSSEADAGTAWLQFFDEEPRGYQGTGTKSLTTYFVRPVRAFGGTVACADGGVCAVGDTGPGGGKVFYVHAGGTFNCGVAFTSTCRYLEVAPSGWNTGADPTKLWAVTAHQSSDITSITNDSSAYNNALGIGLGYKNSLAIVNQVTGETTGNDTTTAAGAARAYGGGAQSDWYLPTTAELNLLCQWARNVAQDVVTRCTGGTLNTGTGASGGFSADDYWSSSEFDGNIAWIQVFDDGQRTSNLFKNGSHGVRPVRAFG